MSENRLIHQLKPGQKLGIRWRKREGFVKDTLNALRLTSENNGDTSAEAYVVWVDGERVSICITRGYEFGGRLEIYIDKKDVAWQEYFEPYASYNQAYVLSRHYVKKFPHDFL